MSLQYHKLYIFQFQIFYTNWPSLVYIYADIKEKALVLCTFMPTKRKRPSYCVVHLFFIPLFTNLYSCTALYLFLSRTKKQNCSILNFYSIFSYQIIFFLNNLLQSTIRKTKNYLRKTLRYLKNLTFHNVPCYQKTKLSI